MKRLVMVVAAVCAFAALAAVAAQGALPFTASLATPAVTQVGERMTLTGTLTPAIGGAYVELWAYDNAQCTYNDESFYVADKVTADDGAFSFPLVSDEPGNWWLAADVYTDDELSVTTNCVPATFVAAPAVVVPPKPASTFLCWNREMTDPVAYEDPEADAMWATGNYLEPQAILGNVIGGTNISAYHLVCNAPATMKPTGEGLGGSGEVYSSAIMTQYHQQHVGGNDLNLYHIYG